MDRLSPELVDIIVSFVPREYLFRYATVSRSWQYAVERETFQSVELKSTELDFFARAYAPSHRRATLRNIRYNISLPEYSWWKRTKFEKPEDQDANNEAFTTAIIRLFDILNGWESDGYSEERGGKPIILRVDKPASPSDNSRVEVVEGDLQENRWMNSVLKLLRPDEVKPVERIVEFCWGEYERLFDDETTDFCMRDTDAAAVACIATKLPRLKTIVWDLSDRDFPGTQPRYIQRHGMFLNKLLSWV